MRTSNSLTVVSPAPAVALALLLSACGGRAALTVDGQIGDGMSGGQDGSSQPDTLQRRDSLAVPGSDLRITPVDALPPDAPLTTEGYLLWQAPGGFAGTGPAIELLRTGVLRIWKATSQLTPHQTAKWDRELALDPKDVRDLFALLRAVDYSKLPHKTGQWNECYPVFYFEPCTKCKSVELRYTTASELLPEMKAVYAAFDVPLKGLLYEPPSGFCPY